jgi:periplasmic divalent cation tolerance protein
MSHIAVVTTVANLTDARAMARALVEDGLAACAQISQIESFYHWDGELQNEPEFEVTFKTRAEHYERIEAAIRERHPYELPDIHAMPLQHVYAPYAHWLEQNTEQVASGGIASPRAP